MISNINMKLKTQSDNLLKYLFYKLKVLYNSIQELHHSHIFDRITYIIIFAT